MKINRQVVSKKRKKKKEKINRQVYEKSTYLFVLKSLHI